jgi:thioredoxin-related protein
MMQKVFRLIFFLIFFFQLLLLSAQTVEITGSCNRPGALIRLIAYTDLLNMHAETKAQTYADENGAFRLQTTISQIGVNEIAIDLERLMLVLKPDSKYDFTIHLETEQTNLSYFDKAPPALLINQADDDGLQFQLEHIDRVVNNFAIDHFKELYQLRRYPLLDTLEQQLKNSLTNENEDYVKEYARYKLAALEMAVKRNGGRQIIADYFQHQPIQYQLEPYMSLFKELFRDYLMHNRAINTSELVAMRIGEYDKWRSILRSDSLLRDNSALADLIIIQSLKDFYYNARFNRLAVRDYLAVLSSEAATEPLRQMANHVLTAFDFLAAGTAAPDFSLENAAQEQKQLADFAGTAVMLVFVDDSCPVCEMLFQNLEDIQQAFENKFQIVVMAFEREAYYAKYLKDMGYEWEVLSISPTDILLLESYNIRTFPELVFITDEGNIGMAPLPYEEIPLKYHLNRLIND